MPRLFPFRFIFRGKTTQKSIYDESLLENGDQIRLGLLLEGERAE